MPSRANTIGRVRRWLLGGLLLLALAGLCVVLVARGRNQDHATAAADATPPQDRMLLLPGGSFRMGDDFSAQADERPAHDVQLDPFWMDEHAVTNRQFGRFVQQTGYVTTAERQGRGEVFDAREKRRIQRQGADWRHPGGPDTRLDGREEFPVVQVSWFDAAAYAVWAGKHLPSEAQWEYAARGGLRDTPFPWGKEERPAGQPPANTWQGWFPDEDQGTDGFRGLAPVGSFAPNRFGLFDVAGNVWQWCADWYAEEAYRGSAAENPTGPSQGKLRVIRGGSYLSAAKANPEYRCAARSQRPPETCAGDLGFRCVRPAKAEQP